MRLRPPGIAAALAAALLFGAGTPLAKLLLGGTDPWLLAGLLYLGSGLGLTIVRALRRRGPRARLGHGQWRWLAGAVFFGGVVGPVLLMAGLARMPASGAALLLNAEAVFTAAIAWVVFRENVDRRIFAGMVMIVAGAVVLAWPSQWQVGELMPALAVVGACLAWGIDNNLTARVALADAVWVASVKGLAAGLTNTALALWLGASWPALPTLAAALVVGLLAYGVSLVFFVVALRHLGTARTGAYFGVAPFFGAVAAVVSLGEPATPQLVVAFVLMAAGVWVHLRERHDHDHVHEPLAHAHAHRHDDQHHEHGHAGGEALAAAGETHTHWHRHDPIEHRHPHFPDAHHAGHRHPP